MSDLGTHRGRPIVGMRMSVAKVGAGLDNPIALDPDSVGELEVGDTVTICVDAVLVDEHFPAEHRKEPAEGGVFRAFGFDATATYFVDPGSVIEARQRHLERVELAQRERAKKPPKDVPPVADGQQELEVDGAALERAHITGDHKDGKVEGCESCAWEDELEEQEADG